MRIIDQEGFYAWFSKQTDAYSRRVFTFAIDWADLMEAELAAGKELKDIARPCADKADTDGITGAMAHMAQCVLKIHWVHGKDLDALNVARSPMFTVEIG